MAAMREGFGIWLARIQRKPAKLCGPGGEHKFTLAHSRGNKKEDASIWPGILQDPKKAYKLKNSATSGSEKLEPGITTEGLRKSLRKPQSH